MLNLIFQEKESSFSSNMSCHIYKWNQPATVTSSRQFLVNNLRISKSGRGCRITYLMSLHWHVQQELQKLLNFSPFVIRGGDGGGVSCIISGIRFLICLWNASQAPWTPSSPSIAFEISIAFSFTCSQVNFECQHKNLWGSRNGSHNFFYYFQHRRLYLFNSYS